MPFDSTSNTPNYNVIQEVLWPATWADILLISSAVAMHSQTNTHSLTAVVTASGRGKQESHGMCY